MKNKDLVATIGNELHSAATEKHRTPGGKYCLEMRKLAARTG